MGGGKVRPDKQQKLNTVFHNNQVFFTPLGSPTAYWYRCDCRICAIKLKLFYVLLYAWYVDACISLFHLPIFDMGFVLINIINHLLITPALPAVANRPDSEHRAWVNHQQNTVSQLLYSKFNCTSLASSKDTFKKGTIPPITNRSQMAICFV